MGHHEVSLPTGSPGGKLLSYGTLLCSGRRCVIYYHGKPPHCRAQKFIEKLERRYSAKIIRRLQSLANDGFPTFEESYPWLKRLKNRNGLFEIKDKDGTRVLLCQNRDGDIVVFDGFMKGSDESPLHILNAAQNFMTAIMSDPQSRNET